MAMINCPECGKEVSSEATACPNCGHPIAQISASAPIEPPKKKGGALKIIIGVVIALLAAPTLLFGGCMATALLFQDYGKVGGTELTITDNEGNVSVVPSNEFGNAWKENEVKYEKLYSGAKIEFDCKIESINSATNWNGHQMDGYIYSDDDNRILVEFSNADRDFMATLDAGDTVHVEGHIFTADGVIEVLNINGHTNTFSYVD